MKKLFCVIMTLTMLLGCSSLTVFADEQPLTANVNITIASKGNLVVANETITVTDRDNSGTLTIDEALYAAHEVKYDGGATAGYNSYLHEDYGLSLGKLWGDNSGNFGYYVNNASAWSLADTVKEGDYLNAFVYSDGQYFSDTYCWFDTTSVSADADEEITLKLSGAGYDANWNPVTLAIQGATITVNGEKTEYKTDAEGKVTLKIAEGGNVIISAVSDTQILVPPVCKATISKTTVVTPTENDGETIKKESEDTKNNNKTTLDNDETSEKDTNTSDTDTSKNTSLTSPKTGSAFNIIFFASLMIVSAAVVVTLFAMRKKLYEK